jgi:membrane-bound serine protease (ClpP class)
MPIEPWFLVLIIILVVICLYFVVLWSVRAHRRKIAAGKEELIGKIAVVVTALNPKGMVLVEGERWTAFIDKGRVEPEEEVVITAVEGLKLMVTRKLRKE